MPDRMRISEDLTVAAQPSEAELNALADAGFKTVINIRTAGEDMQPLSPEGEGDVVRDAGMAYEHLPVSMKDADAALVDRFRETLAAAEKPAFVHCKLGQRAGAMVMMDHAVRMGWTGQQTLDQAKQMGFDCTNNEKLADFVKRYVDQHADA